MRQSPLHLPQPQAPVPGPALGGLPGQGHTRAPCLRYQGAGQPYGIWYTLAALLRRKEGALCMAPMT